MNWEDNYSEHSLEAGYKLYKKGAVKVSKKNDNKLIFGIKGNYGLQTVIDISKKNEKVHSCNCWDARYGQDCEHIVAALYSIEGDEKDKTESKAAKKPVKIKPFSKVKDSEYHYFDFNKITGEIDIFKEEFERANALIEEGRIVNTIVYQFGYSDAYYGDNNKKGLNFETMWMNRENKKISSVIIRTGRDFLWDAKCNQRRCYCYYEYTYGNAYLKNNHLCEHIIASLIMLDRYIKSENPGDATDHKAEKLLGRFRRKNNSESEKTRNVILEPELINKDGEYEAGFKIGTGKLYKVKNLKQLVSDVQNGETHILGKKGAINFSHCDFDEESRPLYEFLQNRVNDIIQRNERIRERIRWGYTSGYLAEDVKDTIPLEGSAIDEFYNLCQVYPEINYTHKEFQAGTKKSMIRLREGNPRIHVELTELKEGKEVAGITLSGNLPNLCQGVAGVYSISDDVLYRSSAEDYAKIKPIMDFSDHFGKFSFNVGRRNLAEFYRSVYPVLEEIAVINDTATSKIEKFIPPVPDVIFFLDSIDNILFCKTQIIYGDNVHSPNDARVKNGFSQIYRDYDKEREICDLVDIFFPEYDKDNHESVCVETESCYRVYREGIDEFLKMGEVRCTDSFQNRKLRKSIGVKVGVSVESDLLNLKISSADLSGEELADIYHSYRLKRKYHVLKNGDFVDLESEDMRLVEQMINACNADLKDMLEDKLKLPLFRALYLDKLLEGHEELYSHRDRNFRKIIKEFGTVRDSDLEPAESLESVLRPYQVFGHKWLETILHNNFGGILADEMGLGKTLQMISVLLAEKEDGCKPALVICPASLVYNWKEEINRFAPELKVCTVANAVKERKEQIADYKSYDVLITSYDLLKRDVSEYQECSFEYQILDEAQYIKNPRTAAAKTVKTINSKHRFALTGTPIENRLSELWSIFDFLMPGFLYDYETFKKNIETPVAKDKDENVSERLKKMVGPFILRRLKTDVLKDLPDKVEEIRYGVMGKEQQKLYDAQVYRISKQIEKESDADFNKSKLKILAEITRTRQLCCDPALVVDDYSGGSAKREACLELINSAIEGEHRVLLFSQFTSMLDILANDLKENNIDYFMLTGNTPKEERIRLMKEFNEGNTPVFLISLKAGGTGLNLTGADIVIHYDPWWNLAVQNQATDRAHRIGQTKLVTVFKLIIKGSIEEKIVKLQESKKDLADEILNGENGTIANLTREDLLELLSSN